MGKGEYRLLLIDGHNSHYTVDFLLYARLHLIVVLCYPTHTTHIYQGLDVVIFSVLKRFIMEEQDKWYRAKGEAMDKNNFLVIYGAAVSVKVIFTWVSLDYFLNRAIPVVR